MAIGLPDYYRGFRPSFGGAKNESDSIHVEQLAETELLSITGKGMVYGGYVYLEHSSTQRDSTVRIDLDGKMISSHSFTLLNKYNIVELRSCPMSLLKYDDTLFTYTIGFAYGLTFESGIKVKYIEQHDEHPMVNFTLIYALL